MPGLEPGIQARNPLIFARRAIRLAVGRRSPIELLAIEMANSVTWPKHNRSKLLRGNQFVFRDWLTHLRALTDERRTARRRNLEFLQQIADKVLDDYKSLPYAMLVDVEKLPGRSERIVNGVWIAWDFDFQKSRDGRITVTLEFHSNLPTSRGAKPSRTFLKRPEDPATPRAGLYWVEPNPVIQIDSIPITPLR